MIDYWNLYDGKTPRELNPYRLQLGDMVIAPDGTIGRLHERALKWGMLEDCEYYQLADLRPLV
ncbi:MAG: hypothetical protein AAGD25_06120 [Cyanobacteria bacterium P01_F01_bin.150]